MLIASSRKALATTSPGGAGKWCEGYNAWLKDRDVIILPDNDEVGRKHANQVAKSIIGAANRVRIVQFPNLDDHGDVSDYSDKHSLEELLSEIGKTQLYDPQISD
jgi:putative DNA primase/helicase